MYTTGSTDTFGYLLNSSGQQIESNDDISSSNLNFRISRQLAAGTYYVRVRHFSSTGTGAYTLVSEFRGNDLIFGRYLPIEDGSIIRDNETGLEWQRCSVGQTWDGGTQSCTGEASGFAWDDAVQVTAPGGFQLPTIEELRTLVYCSNTGQIGIEERSWCGDSSGSYDSPTIVQAAFPNTPPAPFWSASPGAGDDGAWGVLFNAGVYFWSVKSDDFYRVRLVRGGQ